MDLNLILLGFTPELFINFKKLNLMKKLLLCTLIFGFLSCSLEGNRLAVKTLPIDASETPQSFTFNTIDTIKVKYSLPNTCHSYYGLYYQSEDATRIVAVRALEDLNANCTQQVIQRELKVPIQVRQREDYVFKFWKGKDATGKDEYEIKVVPVN